MTYIYVGWDYGQVQNQLIISPTRKGVRVSDCVLNMERKKVLWLELGLEWSSNFKN